MADDPPSRPRAFELAATIAHYRARKAASFERWDLRAAGPTPTAGNRPAEITLDEMYIPLRFTPELAPSELDRGAPIAPDDLLWLRRPQVVIGGAGSGKTTWMRWTFRRLIRDPRAVPFVLELRAIAAGWKTPHDAGRSVDSYLADALTECGTSDADAIIAALLAEPSGPRPVILIDGWDELGVQGERLRERLVEFCGAFPHVVVVVSSRPYGETRPAGAEAFQTLHIQPLSDHDIRLLTTRFHRCAHGLDEAAETRATDEFLAALAASPDARSLAGNALLLTMMLLLSREGPLPDRRHKLYTACLRTMLLHRVTQRERDGAGLDPDQWRPDDSEERLRVVAELAYRMQSEGYKQSRRAPIVCTWDAAVGLLKAEWTWDQRNRFLRWLVANAGVLVDRTDGSVHFAHLSFQEHLAAYYLFIRHEGDERIAAMRAHMADRDWWETLRLWARLTGDHWPEKLSPVLAMLREDPTGYWLAGMIFADGTGPGADFESWAAGLMARLSDPFAWGDACAQAWGACKQADRRAVLAARLRSMADRLHWLEAIWHVHWCQLARLEVAAPPALTALEGPIDSAGTVARARAVFGASPSWPDGGELAVLRLWPSVRKEVGIHLQAAISLGAQRSEIMAMFPALVARATRPWSNEDHAAAMALDRSFGQDFGQDYGRDWVRYFVRYFGREFAQRFLRDFSRDWGRYFGRDFGRYYGRYFGRDFGRYFARYFGRDFVQYFGRDFGRDFGRYFARDFVRYLVRNSGPDLVEHFAQDLGLTADMRDAPWLSRFAFLSVGSAAGRAAPRTALAHGEIADGVPLLALFRAACQASLAPGDAGLRAALARACDRFEGDMLWPALARHVARISTREDRALLEDLARAPEQRAPPLSWALQYDVRGDLVFDDGLIVTLDELGDRSDLPPLPLLDAMVPEPDLPTGEATRVRRPG